MRKLTCLITLFFLILAGCSSDQNAEQKAEQKKAETSATAETAAAEPAAPVEPSFVVIGTGPTSGVKADMTTIYKLDTPESWQNFWTQHNKDLQPAEAAPQIDFDKDMLIAIVDTDQPSSGYELSIEKLQAVDDKLYVFATRKQPGAGCVNLGMISQPYVIIQVPKSALIPELRLTTETVACN